MSRTGRAAPKKTPTEAKMPCHASVIGPKCTLGSKGSSINSSPSVALLEFPSGSAPARLVSPRKLARSGRGGRPAVSARGSRRRGVAGVGLRRLCLLLLFGLFGRSHGHAEDRLRDSARDPSLHLFEEAVRFALVGDERILLAVATQVDALAQLFHRGEVLDPVRVNGAQEDPPLDGAGQLVAEGLLARLVRLLDDLGDAIAQVVLVTQLVAEARRDDIRAIEHRPEARRELVEVPVLRVRRGRRGIDKAVGLLAQELENGLADIALLEDEPALSVDDVALVVEHVVELERALADIEVAALDLDLRLRDCPGDHPRLDRRRVVEAETGHQSRDALGRED